MKIFSAAQIKEWDAFTIAHQPIASIDLMEQAAAACCRRLKELFAPGTCFSIFCGTGNNGGDGLAIARLLLQSGCTVDTCIISSSSTSNDFNINLQRLLAINGTVQHITSEAMLPPLHSGTVVVDAIFGTGLSRPPAGLAAAVIRHINNSGCTTVSIDIPSGLYAESSSTGNTVVQADSTLSFGCMKLAFMMAENEPFTGRAEVLSIGLSAQWAAAATTPYHFTQKAAAQQLVKARRLHSHKGSYGRALLLGGSTGKMGAMVLCTEACLRSGAGLVTSAVPADGNAIIQTAVPEAMTHTGALSPEMLQQFQAVGAGPGWGSGSAVEQQLDLLLRAFPHPAVLDADALNCLAAHPDWLQRLSPGSILTPHPKEFERLFGKTTNDFERLSLAMQQAAALQIVIVLKGHHTAVVNAAGEVFFNSTGNPGMAKGGSGDVLTGLLTGLLAQGYSSTAAAILGVYLHGLAGDCAAAARSQQAMKAGDITANMGKAWLQLQQQ